MRNNNNRKLLQRFYEEQFCQTYAAERWRDTRTEGREHALDCQNSALHAVELCMSVMLTCDDCIMRKVREEATNNARDFYHEVTFVLPEAAYQYYELDNAYTVKKFFDNL